MQPSYLLKVIWAISAISDPTGPHGSLLVAAIVSYAVCAAPWTLHTIANLDLDLAVPLGDVLDRSRDFTHLGRIFSVSGFAMSQGRSCREGRSPESG
ncbi:ENTH domain-containing protein [Alternaria alternata]|nr:ENTH domain-containing protein [Alternaria alternata]